MRNTIIIGGGLSGLISAIQLAKAEIPCLLIEKKSYPLHRVCGEYISNESVPFLKRNGLYPAEFSPPQINRFQLSSVSGHHATIPLDMGGFGISRFAFDNFLYEKAKMLGVTFMANTEVQQVEFKDDRFYLKTLAGNFDASVVIGAFGKRSRLDVTLGRDFVKKRSPYAGVKYHIKTNHPNDLIALHNFVGGYCGISNVEEGITNLCYLTHRDQLRKFGSIAAIEREVLCKNPILHHIFNNSDFLFKRAEVINEISFASKRVVENHILMTGDAAGMITPLCGNGMSMAMHAGVLASTLVAAYCSGKISRERLEREYNLSWHNAFSQRLRHGRRVQNLFGHALLSQVAVNLALYCSPIAKIIVRNTHGEVF